MPSDITGTDLIQEDPSTGRRQMVFSPGPIFANIVLADEINRTPPKTQSALLEAMQEHRVTIQGRTYQLEEPFYVFATQNPIELEGTYPLPEAQLDRFMFHTVIDHPPVEEEFEVVRSTTSLRDMTFERPVSGADLVAFQRLVRRVPAAEPVDPLRSRSGARQSAEIAAPRLRAIKKWAAFGASVRAAQYLDPRREGERADRRPLSRQLRRRPRAGAPRAASSRADELPRAVGGDHQRHPRRSAARSRADAAFRYVMAAHTPSGALVGARFVDPVVLARIGNLELVARSVVDGFINGLHRSPYFGASVDFAEHRGYTPGDDIRRVDWRLFARTDRFYIKEYEADSNSNFAVLLDVSKSMGFGSRGVTKLDYARMLAGCLTYLVHRQRDRVGLVTFDADVVEHVPPSAKHMDVVLHVLDRVRLSKPGELGPPLRKLAEHFARRGVLVLISDLYEDPQAVIDAVSPLRFRGNDIIVFHVLDPAEIDFPYDDASAFEDLESGEQIPVVPEALAGKYREMIRAHIEALPRSSRSCESITRCSTRLTRSTMRSSTTCPCANS